MKKDKNSEESLAFEPPEPEYISSLYVLKIPLYDPHFDDPWELRVYAARLLKDQMGDDSQITDLRVKKPHLFNRIVKRILRKELLAKLYVTVKF